MINFGNKILPKNMLRSCKYASLILQYKWLIKNYQTQVYVFYEGGFTMAYVINDSCIQCGSCAGQCPVGAISEGDGKFEINADTCISCGSCAGGCPVGAISEE